MTVAELIAKLQTLPQDYEVWSEYDGYWSCFWAHQTDIVTLNVRRRSPTSWDPNPSEEAYEDEYSRGPKPGETVRTVVGIR